jgi:hypothetical protein
MNRLLPDAPTPETAEPRDEWANELYSTCLKEDFMKLEDLAFAIAQRVFWELEHTHHFVVPEKICKAVTEKIQQDLDSIVS